MKSLSLPTVDRPADFFLGGVYSIVLSVLIVLVFYKMLAGLERLHSYALKKSSTVTVSLVDIPTPTSKVSETKKTSPAPKPKPAPKPQAKPEPAPVTDISSLFSDVKTQRVVHKKRPKTTKKKIDAKRIASLQSRLKTSKKRAPSATAQKVKSLSLVRPARVEGGAKSSGGAEVNAYYAKIQATIYEHFYPPANSAGSVAQIRIRIGASGKLLGYRVLRYSGEPFFDQEVDRLGQRLRQVTFEKNPKGNETVLDVSLISKE